MQVLAHLCPHLPKAHPPFSPAFHSPGQPSRPENSSGWERGALCPRCPLVLPWVNSGDWDRDVPVGSAAREGTQVLQSVPYLALNECFDMQLFQSMHLSALQDFCIPYSPFLFWLGGAEERAVNFQWQYSFGEASFLHIGLGGIKFISKEQRRLEVQLSYF